MSIALIGGTGHQGRGLAKRFLAAGEEVYIGSRQRDRARESAAELRKECPESNVHGGSNAEVAKEADIVILTIPFASQVDILEEIGSGVDGKIVVDTTVPMNPGKPPTIELIPEGSAAERVQNLLGPDVQVVGAFHTVSAHLLNNLAKPLDIDTIVCGDVQLAKETVIGVAKRIGIRGIDGGPLATAHTLERMTVMLIGMNMIYKKRSIGIHITNL